MTEYLFFARKNPQCINPIHLRFFRVPELRIPFISLVSKVLFHNMRPIDWFFSCNELTNYIFKTLTGISPRESFLLRNNLCNLRAHFRKSPKYCQGLAGEGLGKGDGLTRSSFFDILFTVYDVVSGALKCSRVDRQRQRHEKLDLITIVATAMADKQFDQEFVEYVIRAIVNPSPFPNPSPASP